MFEFDRTNLSIDQDPGLILYDGDSIAAILEPVGDLAEKFGIKDVPREEMVFSVCVYADGSFMTTQVTIYRDGEEEHIPYEPTEAEKKLLWELLEECSQQKHGCKLAELPDVMHAMRRGGYEVMMQ